MKSWLQDNDIKIYSIHIEGKSVVAEWFIRTSKNKIFKYMTAIKLVDIVKKYNNINQSTINMKPIDVKSSTYIDFNRK